MLTGGTLWCPWPGELLKPDLPSTVSAGWGQEKKGKETSKQERANMCTMVSKGHSENLQWIFLCLLSIVDFLPTLVRIGFLPIPSSFFPFPTPSSAVQLEGATHFSPG